VLSIAKVADADYYLKAVVSGIEDYYAIGEEPGGRTAHTRELLGIDGELEPAQLTAVLEGRHPTTDTPLIESANRKIPAFDLTFRSPKSVSLAFALGSPELTAEITAAHDSAVDAALGYLERHAAVSRRGHNGTEHVTADGLIGASFRHRTSRAADPHLHTHALVPNMLRSTDDGRWRTLDARHLYAHSLMLATSTSRISVTNSPAASASRGGRSSTASPTSTASTSPSCVPSRLDAKTSSTAWPPSA
jgi:conjugative relaxase-like TrwC/TraI family protein